MILILAGNAFLFYSSHLGVEGEFKHFLDRQYLVFCLDVLISEKKEVYIYVKGHLTYNQNVCQITRLSYPHALRTYVPTYLTRLCVSSYYVPACLRLLNYCVSTYLRGLSYYMSTCLRALTFHVPTCLCADIYFSCLRVFVP